MVLVCDGDFLLTHWPNVSSHPMVCAALEYLESASTVHLTGSVYIVVHKWRILLIIIAHAQTVYTGPKPVWAQALYSSREGEVPIALYIYILGLGWSCVLIRDHGRRRRQLLIQWWGTVYVGDDFVTKLLDKWQIKTDQTKCLAFIYPCYITRPGILEEGRSVLEREVAILTYKRRS